jgi:hypothetical protein
VFNVWGAADLLVAFYQGLLGIRIDPGWLGAAYFIPTVLVPPLLVTHGLTFSLLLRKQRSASPSRAVMAVIPAEIRATVKLYLDGKIRQWYSRGDGKGVVFLVDAKTEDEARAIMETLPLAKEQLMDHEYVPVGPLMPLRALMGPGAQQ